MRKGKSPKKDQQEEADIMGDMQAMDANSNNSGIEDSSDDDKQTKNMPIPSAKTEAANSDPLFGGID